MIFTPAKLEVLEQRCDVLLITRQSIKRFRDHHVEAAAARVHQEGFLIAWTQMACATLRIIGVGRHERPARGLDPGLASAS